MPRSADLQDRGSPSHDGVAARLVDYRAARRAASRSSCSRCAGRCGWSPATPPRAWPRCASPARPTGAGWPGGARRGSPRGPAAGRSARAARSTSARTPPRRWCASCSEEWAVAPERVRGEALLRLPHRLVMFVGQAWLAEGADEAVTPDHEHDAFAWWPSEIDDWPAGGRRGAAARWRAGCRSERSEPARRAAGAARPFKRLKWTSFAHSCVYLALLVCAFAIGKPEPADVRARADPRAALDLHVAGLHRRRAAAGGLAAGSPSRWRSSAGSGRSSAATSSCASSGDSASRFPDVTQPALALPRC